MKCLAFLVALVAVASAEVPADLSFDDIDLSKYEDKDELENFVKCMADPKRIHGCTDFEVNIRERAPTIVATNCAECTPNEKEAVVFLTSKVSTISQDSGDLTKLLKEFDPTGKHSKQYLEALNNIKTEHKIPKLPDSIIDKYGKSCFD